ncbi:MAG: thiamine diphosphokinase [Chloroflexota bacterium]
MRVVIFANGHLPDPSAARTLLRDDDYLIGADGGAGHLLGMGLLPHLVVGDLDSLDEAALFDLTAADVTIDQYPEDKDETDLELALKSAYELHPEGILIAGGLGGRLDQSLAALSLLAGSHGGIDLRLDDGVEEAFFCRSQAEIRGRSGDTVSLVPWGGPVSGIRTEGLRWPLIHETLYPDRTRGISNEMTDETASVEIESGLLLIVHRRKP